MPDKCDKQSDLDGSTALLPNARSLDNQTTAADLRNGKASSVALSTDVRARRCADNSTALGQREPDSQWSRRLRRFDASASIRYHQHVAPDAPSGEHQDATSHRQLVDDLAFLRHVCGLRDSLHGFHGIRNQFPNLSPEIPRPI